MKVDINIEDLDLLSSGEACKLLGISNARLNFLIKKYKIPHKKVTSGNIFLKKDLLNFQKKREENLKKYLKNSEKVRSKLI